MFWILSLTLVLITVAGLCLPLLRKQAVSASRAEHDMQVYRDQLTELDRDQTRGLLDASEIEATRTEVSRRLLGAAAQIDAENETSRPFVQRSIFLAVGMVVFLIVMTGGIYFKIGAPGLPDQPLSARLDQAETLRANRMSQADAEAATENPAEEPPVAEEYLALVDQLREALKARPDDLKGLRLMAQHLPRIGEWGEAAQVQAEVIRVLGDQATGQDFADLAENMIFATGGYVSPEAEAVLETGMRIEPTNARIRFYAGHALLQSGRPDLTYGLWTRLLQEGPEDAPWIAAIKAELPQVAAAIGAPVPGDRGPQAQDIEAAGQKSPEERQQMIEGMVAQLSDRLASEGGPPEEWAKLIRAYGVLGETARASAIWNEARVLFTDDTAALEMIRAAAREAEVVQ